MGELRRKFAGDPVGLDLFAKEVWASATDTVTLTSGSFEGGSGSGVITFDKTLMGLAIQRVRPEIEGTDYITPPARPMGITCIL